MNWQKILFSFSLFYSGNCFSQNAYVSTLTETGSNQNKLVFELPARTHLMFNAYFKKTFAVTRAFQNAAVPISSYRTISDPVLVNTSSVREDFPDLFTGFTISDGAASFSINCKYCEFGLAAENLHDVDWWKSWFKKEPGTEALYEMDYSFGLTSDLKASIVFRL